MADIEKVRRNVARMIDAGAADSDLSAYLSSEGVTVEQVRGVVPQQAGDTLSLDNIVRQTARGVPVVGSFMDEIVAGADAATYPLLERGTAGPTYSERYATNLSRERAIYRAFETQYPATAV